MTRCGEEKNRSTRIWVKLALRLPPVVPGAGPTLVRTNFGVIALMVVTDEPPIGGHEGTLY